jgi:iron complex transport system substrate-binding protein
VRLVSLTCSNTEIVAALGCGDLLVAVDDHSDFPAEVVRGLPRVGPDLGVDVAAVAALEPDLVLASLTVPGHEKVVAALEAAGLPWIAPAPESLEDVYRDVREIAARLGVAGRGETVVAEMRRRIRPRKRGEGAARPSVLVQWWPKPVIAPGRRSWVTDLIEAAGGVNPLGNEAVLSRPVPFDEVREMDPDAVVLSWCGVEPEKVRPDVVLGNPAYRGLGFVTGHRLFEIPEAYLGRPSPRLVDGYRELCRVVDAVGAG